MLFTALGGGVSNCRSKRPNGELIERTYDNVIASHSFQDNVKNMEVVEYFESRPHKRRHFLRTKRERIPGVE